MRLPGAATALPFRLGDLAGRLGWRPPLRSTAWREIRRGAIGDPSGWTALTGIVPHSFAAALAARPASVQERWFAGLYLLKPVVFTVLSLFWVVTGALSLSPGYANAAASTAEAGAGTLAGAGVIAGSLADIAIGLGIAFRRTARGALWAALLLSVLYLLAATVLMPRLWRDPLGPLVEIVPILVLHPVALAVLEDR
jgi:hypothetical protein